MRINNTVLETGLCWAIMQSGSQSDLTRFQCCCSFQLTARVWHVRGFASQGIQQVMRQ